MNIASVFGMVGVGGMGMALHAASKSGVIGLTKAVAMEYANAGIRVNCVSPGPIDTEALERFVGGDQQAKNQRDHIIPLGRIGQPEEIAAAVVWRCSDAASFVTGHNLVVAGCGGRIHRAVSRYPCKRDRKGVSCQAGPGWPCKRPGAHCASRIKD